MKIDENETECSPLTVASITFGGGRAFHSVTWRGYRATYEPRRYADHPIRGELCIEARRPGFIAGEVRLVDAEGVVARTRFTLFGQDADGVELPPGDDEVEPETPL